MTTEIKAADIVTNVLAKYQAHEAEIDAWKKKFDGVVYDVKTTQGYTGAVAQIKETKTLRNQLDKVREVIKRPYLDITQGIDKKAKEFLAPLDASIKELDAILKIQDEAEKIRTDAIEARIAAIVALPMTLIGKTSEHMNDCKQELLSTDPNTFGEFNYKADNAIKATLVAIQPMIEERERLEAAQREAAKVALEQQAELEHLRAEQAQQQAAIAAEREATAATQRAEQQRLDAERAAIAAEQKSQQEAIDAERRELQAQRDAADRAERERLHAQQVEEARKQAAADALAKAEADRIAAEKLAADKAAQEAALRPDRDTFAAWLTTVIEAAPVLNDQALNARVQSIVTRLATCRDELSTQTAA